MSQKALQPSYSKIFFKFTQIFEIFNHSPFSLKARSMVKCCHWKHGVKVSIVFVIVRFWIVLSIFGKKVESNFTFSAKARSWINRCWWKCGVKLCAFGSIQCIQRIMRFWQIRGVKLSVFAENTELNSAFSASKQFSQTSDYVLGFNQRWAFR